MKSENERRGRMAERRFVQMCSENRWPCFRSTIKQDCLEHWDLEFEQEPGQRTRVDVKSMKAIGQELDTYTWLESRGLPYKDGENVGWVRGKADVIAFENQRGFLMVPRIELLAHLEQILAGQTAKPLHRFDSLELLLHRCYERLDSMGKPRGDSIVLVKLAELAELNGARHIVASPLKL